MKTVFSNDYVTLRGMTTGLSPLYEPTREDIESQIEHLLDAVTELAEYYSLNEFVAAKCMNFVKEEF